MEDTFSLVWGPSVYFTLKKYGMRSSGISADELAIKTQSGYDVRLVVRMDKQGAAGLFFFFLTKRRVKGYTSIQKRRPKYI